MPKLIQFPILPNKFKKPSRLREGFTLKQTNEKLSEHNP